MVPVSDRQATTGEAKEMVVVAESVAAVHAARSSATGLRMTYEQKYLRFFQARFEPLE